MVTTVFIARLLGLFTIIYSLAIWFNRSSLVAATEQLRHDRASLLIVEVIGLGAGLAIVLGHNDWNGLLPIVVSLLGWIILLRAVALLFLPDEAIDKVFEWAAWPQRANVYALVSFIIGLYLTVAGFGG
jgi:uncharacterized membrane protein YfcA